MPAPFSLRLGELSEKFRRQAGRGALGPSFAGLVDHRMAAFEERVAVRLATLETGSGDRAGMDGASCGRTGRPIGVILPQTQGRRHGSFESISTTRIRHGSLPRLTQAWLVACCTITSPGFRCTSPSSSIMSISPERMIA